MLSAPRRLRRGSKAEAKAAAALAAAEKRRAEEAARDKLKAEQAVVAAKALAEYKRVTKYIIQEEKDHSFGNVRTRITLEIEAPDAVTEIEQLQVMMRAAVSRHRKDWPDAVSVRLWDDYRQDDTIKNSIDYAADGCGWAGTNCGSGYTIWTDLFAGEIPPDLQSWGRASEEANKEQLCRRDLRCWAEQHIVRASSYCARRIERLAKYDYKWTDGWVDTKFDRYRWADKKQGVVTYLGNKIKFQNGFGAWSHHSYACDYNPSAKAVMSVNVLN